MATEVAHESTTLSKLARKYYNNTHCWVYIFAANRNQLTGPNNIPTGTKLIIPQIAEEDKKITKAQSQGIYENLK